MDLNDHQRDNLANWDDRVAVHVASPDYAVQTFIDDPSFLSDVVAFDAPLLGDVAGLSLAHLQCHIGTDSISLARLGARVSGLDFSAPAIDAARDLAARTGTTDADFVVASVYDAPAALGRRFDVVYTSVGVMHWLDDLERWAAAVAGLLVPGGRLYLRDEHPSLWAWDGVDGEPVLTYPYVTPRGQPLTTDEQATYAAGDSSSIVHTRQHEWNHPLSEVVTAVAGVGLRIDRLAEHDGHEWPPLPGMTREGSQWFLPAPLRGRVPAMYSLWASAPA